MKKVKYIISDVFSNGKYSGNQLATFFDAIELTSQEMQNIAAEINFSETTFILSDKERKGGYDVRIFTPKAEIDFAGHPTIGTAYLIKHFLNPSNPDLIKLNLKVGQISVTVDNGVYWMKQFQPKFAEVMDPKVIASLLSIDESEIDIQFPIEAISTGLPFVIVPLVDIEALKNAEVNTKLYKEFIQTTLAKGILIFCKHSYAKDQVLGVRVFVPYLGIVEDPATGSGNGCLAAYLLKSNYLSSQKIDLLAGQGYEMDRPSIIHMKASMSKGKYDLNIGGKIELIAEGEWYF